MDKKPFAWLIGSNPRKFSYLLVALDTWDGLLMAGTPLIVPQHHTQTLLRCRCITLTLSPHLHCPLAKLPLPVFHLDIYRRNLWFLHYLPCFIIGLKLAPHSFAFRRAAHAHRAVSQRRFNYAIQRHSTTPFNNAVQQYRATSDHVRRLILRVIKRASSWASTLPW